MLHLPLDTTAIGIDCSACLGWPRPSSDAATRFVIGHRLTDDLGSAHSGQNGATSRGDLDSDLFARCAQSGDEAMVGLRPTSRHHHPATPLGPSSAYQMSATSPRPRRRKPHWQWPTLTAISACNDGVTRLSRRRHLRLLGADWRRFGGSGTAWRGHKNSLTTGAMTRAVTLLLPNSTLKDYPLILTDDGATTDRWAIVFRDGTQFDLHLRSALSVALIPPATSRRLTPPPASPTSPCARARSGCKTEPTPWAADGIASASTPGGTHLGVWILRHNPARRSRPRPTIYEWFARQHGGGNDSLPLPRGGRGTGVGLARIPPITNSQPHQHKEPSCSTSTTTNPTTLHRCGRRRLGADP